MLFPIFSIIIFTICFKMTATTQSNQIIGINILFIIINMMNMKFSSRFYFWNSTKLTSISIPVSYLFFECIIPTYWIRYKRFAPLPIPMIFSNIKNISAFFRTKFSSSLFFQRRIKFKCFFTNATFSFNFVISCFLKTFTGTKFSAIIFSH